MTSSAASSTAVRPGSSQATNTSQDGGEASARVGATTPRGSILGARLSMSVKRAPSSRSLATTRHRVELAAAHDGSSIAWITRRRSPALSARIAAITSRAGNRSVTTAAVGVCVADTTVTPDITTDVRGGRPG